MRVLVADDDSVTRRVLQGTLAGWGYQVELVPDGRGALQALSRHDAAPLALINWMMPDVNGTDVCRRLRETAASPDPYLILLTARTAKEDVVGGLEAGADDYVTKPFDADELRARLRAGERIIGMQAELADSVRDLRHALEQVRRLEGLLPICAYCKRIRDDRSYWHEVERYISRHSEAEFTHSICPECYERHIQPQLEQP